MKFPSRMFNVFITLVFIFTLLISCAKQDKRVATVRKYCSSCHLVPKPEGLPKDIWKSNILPNMANYFRWSKPSDYDYANASIFQKKGFTAMTDKEWEAIESYYLQGSKDSIDIRPEALHIEQAFFKVHEIKDLCKIPTITSVGEYSDSILLAACDNAIIKTDIKGVELEKWQVNDIVTQLRKTEDQKIQYLDVGILDPHDSPLGYLKQLSRDSITAEVLVDSLYRPVDYILEDSILVISEFGNNIGQISSHNPDGRSRQIISNIPGSYRVFLSDIDRDNAKELLFMSAQALEGVYISEFEKGVWLPPERSIAFPPEYGISDMDIADINGDGLPDLILANGDNADYSVALKKYHGIRIYLNKGNKSFKEVFFFPQYGATQVRWIDINGDNKMDFVSSSYFPNDYGNSIIIHINTSSKSDQSLNFESYSVQQSIRGRWMVMERFDIEGDGDDDIIFGSYIIGPTNVSEKLYKTWEESNVDLLILENIIEI